jgi:hypothetical protein
MERDTNLGELITALYEEFLVRYGDPELAAVATAALVDEILLDERSERRHAA